MTPPKGLLRERGPATLKTSLKNDGVFNYTSFSLRVSLEGSIFPTPPGYKCNPSNSFGARLGERGLQAVVLRARARVLQNSHQARGEDLGAQARDEPSKPASSSDWKCTPLPPAGSKSKHAKLRNPSFFAGHQPCGRLKLNSACGSRMRLRGPTKTLLFRMGRRETGSGHGLGDAVLGPGLRPLTNPLGFGV